VLLRTFVHEQGKCKTQTYIISNISIKKIELQKYNLILFF